MPFSLKLLFLVLLAGALGTLCRFTGTRLLAGLSGSFPFATLTVNLLGSFLAGFLFVLFRNRFLSVEPYLPVLFIGFLGAFTTFSTFALESTHMILAGAYWKAAGNIVLQNVSGILAVLFGMAVCRALIL